jgi:peptide/nickel transport system permease protein
MAHLRKQSEASGPWVAADRNLLYPATSRALGLIAVARRMMQKPITLIAFVVLSTLILVSVFSPWVSPHDRLKTDYKNIDAGPSLKHPMGQDEVGRDLLSRLMYAGRVSLAVAAGAEAIALIIGVPIGLAAGFFRGVIDAVLMRIIDGILAFPSVLLALVIAAIFSARFFPVMIAIGITIVPAVARIVRAGTLREKEREYVLASHSMGASPARTALRHILPNTLPELTIQITLGLAFAILVEATLSFIGLGVQPPNSSWGTQLQYGYREIWLTPWPVTFSGMFIFSAVWAFNVIGDALRDTLDPRLRGT